MNVYTSAHISFGIVVLTSCIRDAATNNGAIMTECNKSVFDDHIIATGQELNSRVREHKSVVMNASRKAQNRDDDTALIPRCELHPRAGLFVASGGCLLPSYTYHSTGNTH